MGLPENVVPLKFGKLDTKTDPRWMVQGDLVSAQNISFSKWPKIKKRPGYKLLAAASAGAQLAPYKNQLLIGTGSEAYSYAASGIIDKGPLESMTVSALPVRRDAYTQSTQDSAVHPLGISVYTWESSVGTGAQYSVFDTASGQPIVSGATISATAVKPKPIVLAGNVVIIFYDTSDAHIRFIAIPALAPTTATAVADLATDPSTTQLFDAAMIGSNLYVAYYNNGGSGQISIRYLTPALVVSSALVVSTFGIVGAIGVFGDAMQNVWCVFNDTQSVTVRCFAYDNALANIICGQTTVVVSAPNTRNVCGISTPVAGSSLPTVQILHDVVPTGGLPHTRSIQTQTVQVLSSPRVGVTSITPSITGGGLAAGTYYYRISAISSSGGESLASIEYSATVASGSSGQVILTWDSSALSGAASYRIYRGTTAGGENQYFTSYVANYDDTGGTGQAGTPPMYGNYSLLTTSGVVGNSVGLASKPFLYGGRVHVLGAYQSALQSTYFLFENNVAVAKLSPSTGGGLTAKTILPEVCSVSPGVYTTTYLQADQLSSIGGNVFTQAGVMQGTFDFTQPQSSVELSDDLHLTGGILSMYDGAQVCEHGFNLYPEGLTFTAGGSGTFSGSYQACATYEWMDAQGLLHQSSPSPIVTATAASTAYFDYSVAPLLITSKTTPISVVFWRTLANQAGPFYRVTPITTPNINPAPGSLNPGLVSAPTHADTVIDTIQAGNAQLYSNPENVLAEVPNIAAPAPLYIWKYRNRISLIPAENAYQWTYSKSMVGGVPIEFNSQQLFQSVAQTGGPLTCGIEMDEKNILFTASKIYYVVGDGPAPNGTGSDYASSPQAVPVDVGCTNSRSLVLTPMGVMFQASYGKGIYLLGRDLSVQYIGADVEAYNALAITQAKIVPNTRRIIFFTATGTAIVYDYYAQKWATFTNHTAADACVFQGINTYIQPNGALMQETSGAYTDNGSPILIGLQTSILSFAGISGYQRVWRFMLRGDYRSPHILQVSIAFDGSPAPSQFSIADGRVLGASTAGDTILGDTENPGDGTYPAWEYLVKIAKQLSTSIQITIQEQQTIAPYGEGLQLSAMSFLVGTLKGLHPVANTRSV